MVQFYQYYKTSSKSRGGSGTLSHSESLDYQDVGQLLMKPSYSIPTLLSSSEPDLNKFPTLIAQFRLQDKDETGNIVGEGKLVFSHITYVGKDNTSNRFGNVFCHSLVCPKEGCEEQMFPIEIFETIDWKTRLSIEEDVNYPQHIPVIEKQAVYNLSIILQKIKSFINTPERQIVLQKIIIAIINSFSEPKNSRKKIIIYDTKDNINQWFYIISSLFPQNLFNQVSFISMSNNPLLTDFDIVGIVPENDYKHLDNYKDKAVYIDCCAMDCTIDECQISSYAEMIRKIITEENPQGLTLLFDLIKEVSVLKIDKVLNSVADLCLFLDNIKKMEYNEFCQKYQDYQKFKARVFKQLYADNPKVLFRFLNNNEFRDSASKEFFVFLEKYKKYYISNKVFAKQYTVGLIDFVYAQFSDIYQKNVFLLNCLNNDIIASNIDKVSCEKMVNNLLQINSSEFVEKVDFVKNMNVIQDIVYKYDVNNIVFDNSNIKIANLLSDLNNVIAPQPILKIVDTIMDLAILNNNIQTTSSIFNALNKKIRCSFQNKDWFILKQRNLLFIIDHKTSTPIQQFIKHFNFPKNLIELILKYKSLKFTEFANNLNILSNGEKAFFYDYLFRENYPYFEDNIPLLIQNTYSIIDSINFIINHVNYTSNLLHFNAFIRSVITLDISNKPEVCYSLLKQFDHVLNKKTTELLLRFSIEKLNQENNYQKKLEIANYLEKVNRNIEGNAIIPHSIYEINIENMKFTSKYKPHAFEQFEAQLQAVKNSNQILTLLQNLIKKPWDYNDSYIVLTMLEKRCEKNTIKQIIEKLLKDYTQTFVELPTQESVCANFFIASILLQDIELITFFKNNYLAIVRHYKDYIVNVLINVSNTKEMNMFIYNQLQNIKWSKIPLPTFSDKFKGFLS